MLTLRPIHLMVPPISSSARGERIRSIVSILSVGEPALRTELPLYTWTLTSTPLRTAAPTSISVSIGSPRRMALESLLGTKRTRPGGCQYLCEETLGR